MDEKFKSHFLNLYHMALSDTEIDICELEMLSQIGSEKGVSREDIEGILLNPDTIRFRCPDSVVEKIEHLYDFARMAWADGIVTDGERTLMCTLSRKFGFLEENVPLIVQFVLDEVEKKTSKEDVLRMVAENL